MLLRATAVTVAAISLVSRADCAFVYGTCSIRNLLGYFTIDSAILFCLVTAASLIWVLVGAREPVWLLGARVIVGSYVILSGGVFAMLMSAAGYTGAEFLVPMSSRVLHFILPGFVLLDLLTAETSTRLPRALPLISWVFPLGWEVVTLIRGNATDWYPYFFVSPEAAGGPAAIAAYSAGLALLIAGVVVAVERLRAAAVRTVAGSRRSCRTGAGAQGRAAP
ncbi:hypothetical protein B5808_19190 (plasmid) [Cnuibacter physcomitrellae]|uniref:Uncharacterized protein n=1 Tax=Cnuibacter physcomitrellae TaxID=1619308 RepID=A0A1X9LT75_9MICO|nr:hypothetical protein B5808_19190 [Cnuibacter physcomitrellae]